MLKPFLADLHIHTVLSGCAEVEMIPPLILRQAQRLGLSLIAITDHNACHNVEAVMEAAVGTGIHVLPGMELQSKEEVHLLCLFDTVPQCQEWQEEVFQKLPSLANREEVFGGQYVVDATGEWMGTEERLLAASVDMALEEVISKVRDLGRNGDSRPRGPAFFQPSVQSRVYSGWARCLWSRSYSPFYSGRWI